MYDGYEHSLVVYIHNTFLKYRIRNCFNVGLMCVRLPFHDAAGETTGTSRFHVTIIKLLTADLSF